MGGSTWGQTQWLCGTLIIPSRGTVEQVLVDAADRNTADDEAHNKKNYVNRQEFLQILVRLAIAKYMSVRTGQRKANMTDARMQRLNRFFCQDIDAYRSLIVPDLRFRMRCVSFWTNTCASFYHLRSSKIPMSFATVTAVRRIGPSYVVTFSLFSHVPVTCRSVTPLRHGIRPAHCRVSYPVSRYSPD